MQEKQLALKPQTNNACTLISIGVIKAILSAKNEDELFKSVLPAHETCQTKYAEIKEQQKSINDLSIAYGSGISEQEAYQLPEFKSYFLEPQNKLLNWASLKDVIQNVLASRNNLIRLNGLVDGMDDFFTFSADDVEVINKARKDPKTIIEWQSVTQEELEKLLNVEKSGNNAETLFLEVLTSLRNEGITITTEGHTISVVKKDNIYYTYNSYNGCLHWTSEPKLMVKFLNEERFKRESVTSATVCYFTPSPSHLAKKGANKQVVEKQRLINPEKAVVRKEEKNDSEPITREEIEKFINNRTKYRSTGKWKSDNNRLIIRIYNNARTWHGILIPFEDISAEKLCEILGLPPKSINTSPSSTKTFNKQNSRPSSDSNDNTIVTSNSMPNLYVVEKQRLINPEKVVVRKEEKNDSKLITREEIEEFINDRVNYRSPERWKTKHNQLITKIYEKLKYTWRHETLIPFEEISAEELCNLLGLPPKSINTSPSSTKTFNKQNSRPSSDSNDNTIVTSNSMPNLYNDSKPSSIEPSSQQSLLTDDQLKKVNYYLETLTKEIKGPYPNRGLKETKLKAFNYLFDQAKKAKNLRQAVLDTIKAYPLVKQGFFSTRSADLLAELAGEKKQSIWQRVLGVLSSLGIDQDRDNSSEQNPKLL